jgi:hypothetical protein
MPFVTRTYIQQLDAAGIGYEQGSGKYKGDYYVAAGSSTPHIHVAKSGEFVGLKKKMGAITTLVKGYIYNRDAIESSIDDIKMSVTPNDTAVAEALRILGRQEKSERA